MRIPARLPVSKFGRSSRDTNLQVELRRAAMIVGMKHHIGEAEQGDKTYLQQQLAIAQRNASMTSPLFIWLKPRLIPNTDPMTQWASYETKSCPKAVKNEYRQFWQKVVKVYQQYLKNIEKSVSLGLAGQDVHLSTSGVLSLAPQMLVPAALPFRKSVTYSMERDNTCKEGEFILLHPKSGKRYKCKIGKIEEVEKMGSPMEVVKSVAMFKSWSTGLMKKHPGARWVTVTDSSSSLHGRHILLMPHANGTASIVWAPEHSGLTHKILQPKKKERETEETKKTQLEAKAKKEEARAKKREEMSEADVTRLETEKESATEQRTKAKGKLHEMIREKLGEATEITTTERQKIEQKIEKLSKPEQTIERLREINEVQKERRAAINSIIEESKKAMIGELPIEGEDRPEYLKRRNEIIRENAEEFLQAYYTIKGHEKELKVINKQLRTGMVTHPGSDIVGIDDITSADLKRMVSDEQALRDEIAAHYDLIISTRGGIDQDGKEIDTRGSGRKDMEKIIHDGSLEAINGITGEMAGTSIIDIAFMQELGAANAAILADHYLREKMGEADYAAHVKEFEKYIETKGTEVAMDAVKKGDKYLKDAEHMGTFNKTEGSLFASRQQGTAAKLAYVNRAYLAYGQAEGGLHMAAEMLYQFQSKKKDIMIKSANRPALNAKVKKLGLNPSDVRITRLGHGDYEMKVKPGAYQKLIHEKAVAQFKSMQGEPTPQSIKAGRENRPDWLPAGIKSFIPQEDGTLRKVVPESHQQASARLLENQNKIYLNHEAGTGKSLTYVLQKAHLEEKTGKPVKTVISMPKKLMENFADEVRKFSNFDVAIVDHTDKSKREAAYKADPNTIVLVNKEKFHFDHDMVKEAGFDLIINDEAHRISQRGKGDTGGEGGSQMSKGLAKIAKNAKYYVAGTGTPTPNDLSELYFHLNIMDPKKFSSEKKFMEKYGKLHKGAGLKDKLKDILNAELDDKVFTVKKKVTGANFNYHIHKAELTEKQRADYQKVQQQFLKKKINPMSRDQKISSILNDTSHKQNQKYDKVKSIIDDHIKNKAATGKIVLYAKNYSTVKEIEKFLRANYPGRQAVRFAGQDKNGRSMSLKQIAANKKTFLTDPKAMFAIHTDAGTEGLNLQHTGESHRPYGATTAIAVASGAHGWANIDQFFSRGYRMGATEDVDGHMVLTDTPHDMATEERLREKKDVMNMLQEGSKIDDMNVMKQRIAEQAASFGAQKSMGHGMILPRLIRRAS